MRRRSTVRLPLAVLVTVTAAMVAVMMGRPEAALFGAPWAVLLVVGLSSSGDHRVRARAGVDADRIVVGDDVELEVTLRPESRGWFEVRPVPESTYWPDDVAPQQRQLPAVADTVRSGRPKTVVIPMASPMWGRHDLGRVQVTMHESYGLFERSGMITEPCMVRVHPTPLDLRRLLTPWLVRRKAGTHPSSAIDQGVEFADIRPFGPGDSPRDINWRASARSEGIVVSQRHPERATDVVLLVDSFVESGHDVRAVVGLAVEACVALAESHLALTDRVGLVELGGVLRWVSPGTGRVQLHRLTDALLGTRLYANSTDRNLTILPPRALPPRSFVVALTPLLDPRFTDALLTLRGGGHDVAVVECLYEPPPSDSAPDPELAKVAVQMFTAERMLVRDRLAGQGIAIGQWKSGDHLDLVLDELAARRRHVGGVRR